MVAHAWFSRTFPPAGMTMPRVSPPCCNLHAQKAGRFAERAVHCKALSHLSSGLRGDRRIAAKRSLQQANSLRLAALAEFTREAQAWMWWSASDISGNCNSCFAVCSSLQQDRHALASAKYLPLAL